MFNQLIRNSKTGLVPLDDTQLAKLAPSIFATEAYHACSDRYGFIPTIRVVHALRAEGWQAFHAAQASARNEDKRSYTRHLIRFRHAALAPVVGDTFPEIVLLNSHDATSAYQMHAGFFRLACSNGLIVADATFSKLSIRHSGDVVRRVIDGAAEVVREVPRLADNVERMRAIALSDTERGILASAALTARYGDDTPPVAPEQLLRPRRAADSGNDLWRTLNTVQENLLRGGLRGFTTDGKRVTTRRIKSINEDTKLNKALWELATRMQDLKAAA
jgi:hypothetical protein